MWGSVVAWKWAERVSRPRVEGEREQQILDVTLEVLMEVGYERLTMDAVAGRARTSKATLYRRWRSKSSLVIQALVTSTASPRIELCDTGSLRSDLIVCFRGYRGLSGAASEVFGSIVTVVSTEPGFAEEFRVAFIAPKLAVVQTIFQRARARREIPEDVEIDLLAPVLPAVLLHRALMFDVAIDDRLVERVVDQVILPAARYAGHETPRNDVDTDGQGRTT